MNHQFFHPIQPATAKVYPKNTGRFEADVDVFKP